ncbi:MAG: DNA gyrase inhibitor YacG [Methylococcales bacterium]
MSSSLVVKCPSCKRAVPWTAEQQFKPFCSERCRLIDLGEWVMEEKRIAGESLLSEDNNDDNVFFQ